LRVAASASAGLAKAAAGEFAAGAALLSEAIDFARSARAGLEFEARMLADLADARYRAGDRDAASAAADEAVAVARRRTDRIAELHATLLRGLVLADADDAENDKEVGELILRAEELLNVSGAAFFEPRLTQLRSRLEQRG
jgi:adenylate cyclase